MLDALLKSVTARPRKAYRNYKKLVAQKQKQKNSELIRKKSREDLEYRYGLALRKLSEELGDAPIGDYLEFGVFFGTSMTCMHNAQQTENLGDFKLFGFDSFEGLPNDDSEFDKGYWNKGDFSAAYEDAKKVLSSNGIDWNKTFLIKGWYSDSLNEQTVEKYNIKKAGVIMMDCDMYSSTKEALDFCAQFIVDKAIIFFDDWMSAAGNLVRENKGQYRAYKEFLEANKKFRSVNMPELEYLTQDPSGENFAKVFLVSKDA